MTVPDYDGISCLPECALAQELKTPDVGMPHTETLGGHMAFKYR
jgi:hypothetical protein